ncbi:hypothetical protein ACFL6R_01380 [Gemmatimonadota bacterium]
MTRQFPPLLLARATVLLLNGRVHFPKEVLGEVIRGTEEDFAVFRKVTLDPADAHPGSPGAIFEVRFQFAKYAEETNRRLSFIPIPLIIAQPGFRSKTWATGLQTGMFMGLYEWDTVEQAEAYWTSFPMDLMKRRAADGTLTREIRET